MQQRRLPRHDLWSADQDILSAFLELTRARLDASLAVVVGAAEQTNLCRLHGAAAETADVARLCHSLLGAPVEVPPAAVAQLLGAQTLPVADLAGATHGLSTIVALLPETTYCAGAPIAVDGSLVAILVVFRRTDRPFTREEFLDLTATGRRVAALGTPEPAAVAAEVLRSVPEPRRWLRDRPVPSIIIGLAVPVGVVAAVSSSDDPAQFRPLPLLVGVVAGLAVMVGHRAAIAAAVSAAVMGWWWVIEPVGSFRLSSLPDAVGLGVYIATLVFVAALVQQLVEARQHMAEDQAIVDELFDQTPVGIALFDSDLRFQRINRHLADLNGFTRLEHLGRRPGEISPFAGEAYEHLLARALQGDETLGNQHIAVQHPVLGEKHWRVNYYPIVVAGRKRWVGATVEDTTAEVIRLRRAELLLAVARSFATAPTVGAGETKVAELVAEALGARVLVVHRAPQGVQEVRVAIGYGEDHLWAEGIAPDRSDDLWSCITQRRQVISHHDESGADPGGAEAQLRHRCGDRTVVWQPVLSSSGEVVGAFSVAWPFRRQVTDESGVLFKTIATVVGLSVERIELFEQQAKDRFGIAMEAMIDQVTLARAVRDPAGKIVDFVIEFVNSASNDGAGRTAEELMGQRVCDLYPAWRTSGMFDKFCDVVITGEPMIEDRLRYDDDLPDGTVITGWWNLQVVRFDDGYLAASRNVTEAVEAERVAAALQREAERESIAVDLLQQAALPAQLPQVSWVRIGAAYRPAARNQPIGGDWYDAFELTGDRVCIVIADVSGHGPAAAAFMVQVRNILRAIAVREGDPAAVLSSTNDVLHTLGRVPLFATACCAIVDRSAAQITWALAGHPPPVLSRADGAIVMAVDPGPPLNVLRSGQWPSRSMALRSGDCVVGYTDGLIENRTDLIDVGLARLQSLIEQLRHLGPQELADHLGSTVPTPEDDIAVICLQVDWKPV